MTKSYKILVGKPECKRTHRGPTGRRELKRKKYKPIPVTGRGGTQGYGTSKVPHFLNSRLKDGSEVVSLTRRQPFAPRKIPGNIKLNLKERGTESILLRIRINEASFFFVKTVMHNPVP
jgi:hypothetical protein